MAVHKIYTKASRAEVRSAVALLGAILTARAPDQHGIAKGFMLRLSMVWLTKVKQAFLVKARGGTDEAGYKWKPLSAAYLAYGRRFGPGEQARLKRAAGLGKEHKYAPGNKVPLGPPKPGKVPMVTLPHRVGGGLLNKYQADYWWTVYLPARDRFAASMSIERAKARAAALAWNAVKKLGGKTKLEVFGSRQVDILRDTGVLFNSLSPGTVGSPVEGQVLEATGAEVVVGTNVRYAIYHHRAKKLANRRELWPDADRIPASWWDAMLRAGNRGLVEAVSLLVGGRAA